MTDPKIEATEAEKLRLRGDHVGAINRFSVALGNPAISESLRSWCHAHRGVCRGALGLLQEANEDFDAALAENPNYIWARAQRGEAHRVFARDQLTKRDELQRFQETVRKALADFSAALELNPNYTWARAHRGATGVLAQWNHIQLAAMAAAAGETPVPVPEDFPTPASIHADLDEAVRLEGGGYSWALLFKALLKTLLGEPGTSATLKQVLALGSRSPVPIITALALSELYANDAAAAEEASNQLLLMDGDSFVGHFVRARIAKARAEANPGSLSQRIFECEREVLQILRDRIDVLIEDLDMPTPQRNAPPALPPLGRTLENATLATRLLPVQLLQIPQL